MSYSFKEDVISKLPSNCTFLRMYSLGPDTSSIDVTKNNIKTTLTMTKVDLTDYFLKVPTIRMDSGTKMNDLYNKISDMFGLGLLANVDYYDTTPLNLSSNALYVELPISNNSYGYKGTIRCYVVLDAFNGGCPCTDRNLCLSKTQDTLLRLKLRNYFMGNMAKIETLYYVENSLSLEFIYSLLSNVNEELGADVSSWVKDLLIGSTLKETYTDGLSDIAIIITKDNELFQIRYLGNTIKNNEKDDSTSDNSQELPDGNGEDPVGGKGDIIIGEQSEHPYSSVDLLDIGDTDIDIE